MFRVVVQRDPELSDAEIQPLVELHCHVGPNALPKLFAGDDVARPLEQYAQHARHLRSETFGLGAARQLAAHGIKAKVGESNHGPTYIQAFDKRREAIYGELPASQRKLTENSADSN
jgi:hypothetical protein